MLGPCGTVVCPLPSTWAEIHRRLKQAAGANPNIPSPPAPLILAGWAYSNDTQKRDRWQQTVAWANRYGLQALVADLPHNSMYAVFGELTDYQIGPLGGPMYLEWNHDPKPRIEVAERAEAVEVLRSNWVAVVGDDLGSITSPVSLTGAKGRRLLVAVNSERKPPWGSWTTLAPDERRRFFTAFRAAVNRAISPLEVDHIDFVRSADD